MQNSVLSSLNMGCTHLKVTLKKGKHEYSQKIIEEHWLKKTKILVVTSQTNKQWKHNNGCKMFLYSQRSNTLRKGNDWKPRIFLFEYK